MPMPTIDRRSAKHGSMWGAHPCPPNACSSAEFTAPRSGSWRWAIVALLVTLSTAASPQRAAFSVPARNAAPGRAAAPLHSRAANFALARNAHASGFRRFPYPYAPYASLPFPFFGDDFDPNDIYSTGYPVASQPPPFLLEAARALATSPNAMGFAPALDDNRDASSSQPLMIELQNGRYVRLNPAAANGDAQPLTAAAPAGPPRDTEAKSTRASAAPSPRDLPPATLIFRDGHTEEVRDYTIADGILYARGDYYTDGYWNKKIALATLNLPGTLQANAARDVKFILPSSPNEVITRP